MGKCYLEQGESTKKTRSCCSNKFRDGTVLLQKLVRHSRKGVINQLTPFFASENVMSEMGP
jgi:hypothetical protein